MKVVDKIRDGVFIGSIHGLEYQEALKANGITGIISVLRSSVPDMTEHGFKHIQIQVDDEDSENILQHFGETNKFIEEILKDGQGVLVHCAAGVSRSVAIVCAYILYAAHQNGTDSTVDEALEEVKQHRTSAGPNDGFMEQLQVYVDCGYSVSADNKVYRQWLLKKQAEDSSYTGQAPTVTQFVPTATTPSSGSVSQLRCKKCSTPLAASPGFITHTPSTQTGPPTHIPRNGLAASASLSPLCMQYFMEPALWMKPELDKGLLVGKFACPRCAAKVGSYSWKGGKCSCGTWVTPAIELQRARVDEVRR